jgi:hypothetical protein
VHPRDLHSAANQDWRTSGASAIFSAPPWSAFSSQLSILEHVIVNPGGYGQRFKRLHTYTSTAGHLQVHAPP